MRTEWLEWLVLFKKYNSLQKVSNVCHVTPQNIGKMFDKLEEEMGVTLFERKGRNLSLTSVGVDFAMAAENIVYTIENLKDKYAAQQEELTGTIEIVGASKQIVQNVLISFMQRYPKVRVQYTDLGFREALDYVKKEPSVLAFVPIFLSESFNSMLKEYESNCNINLLFKDEQRVFISKNSELAGLKSVSFNDLKKEKIIIYARSDAENGEVVFKNFISKNDLAFEMISTNSMDYFMTVVEKNLAVGLAVYSNYLGMEKRRDVLCLKIRDANDYMWSEYYWALVYNIHKKFTLCDKAMITAIEQYCRQFDKI